MRSHRYNRFFLTNIALGAALVFLTASSAWGQLLGGSRRKQCPPPPCPVPEYKLPPVAGKPEPGKPEEKPAPEPVLADERFAALASETTALAAPNMIGDLQGSACGTANFGGQIAALVNHPTFACSRAKIAENNSPMPRDRAYFTYHHFHNATDLALADDAGNVGFERSIDINRFVFGVEKTWLDGRLSTELRVPFAYELTNNLLVDNTGDAPSITDDEALEFGNLAVALKVLLAQSPSAALSGGLLAQFPSARDVLIRDVQDDQGVLIDNLFFYRNEAVIVSPFVALLLTPGERLFLHGFAQLDVDVNGNSMEISPTVNGIRGTTQTFHLEEQTLLRLDVGGGYWLYRNLGGSGITGIAAHVEAHYTTTLEDADLGLFTRGDGTEVTLGNAVNRLDLWNLTLGATLETGNRATIASGVVIPLSDGDNKPFDIEFVLQINYRFGGGY